MACPAMGRELLLKFRERCAEREIAALNQLAKLGKDRLGIGELVLEIRVRNFHWLEYLKGRDDFDVFDRNLLNGCKNF